MCIRDRLYPIFCFVFAVASFAYDAWIEISLSRDSAKSSIVASFAYDAWIEIGTCRRKYETQYPSHRLRTMRGLKLKMCIRDSMNTVSGATRVFECLKKKFEQIPERNRPLLILLTTNLCPDHKKRRIQQMINALKENIPVLCVSTSLIEAGVDISFDVVLRACSGLDSLIPVSYTHLDRSNVGQTESPKTGQRHNKNIPAIGSHNTAEQKFSA